MQNKKSSVTVLNLLDSFNILDGNDTRVTIVKGEPGHREIHFYNNRKCMDKKFLKDLVKSYQYDFGQDIIRIVI